jgi:hypothetical protein
VLNRYGTLETKEPLRVHDDHEETTERDDLLSPYLHCGGSQERIIEIYLLQTTSIDEPGV